MEPPPSDDSNEPTSETYHRGRKRKPAVGLGAGLVVAAGVAWACVRYRPTRVAVEGASMMPTLFPGDWVLAVVPRSPRRGDVVVVEHPGRPGYEMVKRIIAMPGDRVGERTLSVDEWWVEGDHGTSSTDSRHFGPVVGEEIRARVVLIYWPKERRRRVR
jgi:nickel-type superoxide dismutase maturation protease